MKKTIILALSVLCCSAGADMTAPIARAIQPTTLHQAAAGTTQTTASDSNWSGAGIYDFQAKLACAGVAFRMKHLTSIFGINGFTLDLNSFLGTTNGGATAEAINVGPCFQVFTGGRAYVGFGGDQIGGQKHIGFCVQGGLYITGLSI